MLLCDVFARDDAESLSVSPVNEEVVTALAYFDDNQRAATKDAATIAGLDVARS